jgi:hypothetical protein
LSSISSWDSTIAVVLALIAILILIASIQNVYRVQEGLRSYEFKQFLNDVSRKIALISYSKGYIHRASELIELNSIDSLSTVLRSIASICPKQYKCRVELYLDSDLIAYYGSKCEVYGATYIQSTTSRGLLRLMVAVGYES